MKKNNKDRIDFDRNNKKQLAWLAKYSGLAFQMIAIILLVLFAGMKLDQFLKNEFPLFTIIGAFGGVTLSLYFVLKDLLRKK